MAWKMLGNYFSTADVSGIPTVTQRFRHPTKAMVLRGAQIGIILVNNPTFTAIEARLYSDSGGSPKKLLATSTNQWLKSQLLLAEDNGVKFAGFTFNYVNLQKAEWYHLALVPLSYTGDANSHVAWRMSYPDPQYPDLITMDAAHAANHHLDFGLVTSMIGGET